MRAEADDVIRWKRPGRVEDHKGWMVDRSAIGIGFLSRSKTAPRVGEIVNVRRLEDDRWVTIDRTIRVARATATSGDELVMVGCSIE
jgi:hypothetical protein